MAIENRNEVDRLAREFIGKAAYLLTNRHRDLWELVHHHDSAESPSHSFINLREACFEYACERGVAIMSAQNAGDKELLLSLALLPFSAKLALPGGVFLGGAPRFSAEITSCLLAFEGFVPAAGSLTKTELLDILTSEYKEIIEDAKASIGENPKNRLYRVLRTFIGSHFKVGMPDRADLTVFANARDFMERQGNNVFVALGL